MILTDKCLAIASAMLLIYGMVVIGSLPASSIEEDHSRLTHGQTQKDTPHPDSART